MQIFTVVEQSDRLMGQHGDSQSDFYCLSHKTLLYYRFIYHLLF